MTASAALDGDAFRIEVWDYEAEQWEVIAYSATEAEATDQAGDLSEVHVLAIAEGITPGPTRVVAYVEGGPIVWEFDPGWQRWVR